MNIEILKLIININIWEIQKVNTLISTIIMSIQMVYQRWKLSP